MIKSVFSASLLQSSVTWSSEIILILLLKKHFWLLSDSDYYPYFVEIMVKRTAFLSQIETFCNIINIFTVIYDFIQTLFRWTLHTGGGWGNPPPPPLCKALWVPRKALYKCNKLLLYYYYYYILLLFIFLAE